MDDPAIARFAPVLTEITDGLDFPEGPVALPDGSVVVVEMFGEKLTRVTPDGGHETIADIPGGPNGAALGPEGEFYVCNNGGAFRPARLGDLTFPGGFDPSAYIGGRIQRVDVDGTVTDLYTECEGRPLRAPNDLVLDAHGGMWFTDHGIRDRAARTSDLSGLYWAALDGSEIREVVFPVEGPNGIGLSPSGDRLYWAETMNGRVHQRVVAGPGDLVRPEPLDPTAVLAGLPGNRYLDSLAVDGDGWVCVATIFDGGVTAISPDGTTIEHHATGDVITTNVCFGGADLTTAFVTLSSTGRLVSMPWPRPGLRLAHQQL